MRSFTYLPKLFLLAAMLGCLLSCRQEEAEPEADILFSLNVEGPRVTFQNQTTGATAYWWDFGDGQSSTEESPAHEYPKKGKYVVTLYATAPGGKTTEGSTVLQIAKTSPVKLDDGSLPDWAGVTDYATTCGANGGKFKKAKFDYDGQFIYFYFELASTEAAADIFDFYLDTDNDATTGLLTAYFPGGGYDVLLEGAMLTGWFDVFYHKGAQTAFSFEAQTITDYYTIGSVKEEDGLLKLEGRLERAKLKGVTGKAIKIGVAATKNDWSAELGTTPNKGTAPVLLNLDE